MNARWLAIMTLVLVVVHGAVPAVGADEEVERHCFGLLWCTEREGDYTYRDGFLWLYSSEQRGPYSRLAIRPFYSEEFDPTKDLLRRSVLWPLGTYDRVGDSVSSRLVPFYWHGEEPSRHYTLVPPLYLDYANNDRSSTFFLPLYGHRAQGGYYHQRFFLGPLLISTQDARHDLHRWDFLFPLGGHNSYADGSDTWLAPVYFSGHEDSTGRNYRFLLPVYGQSESPDSRFRFLVPVFGSVQDDTAQLHRFSLLGFPPLPTSRTLPALAFYERVTAPDLTSHRLFPLFRYVAHDTEGTDLDVLLLYQYRASVQAVAHRLFPLYNLEEDRTRLARDFSIIGFRQWSLFHSVIDPSQRNDRFLGLYGYNHDVQDESSTLGILGYGDLSLFRYHGTRSELAHRVFPFYRYRHDRVTDETQFDTLLLHRHLTSQTRTADRLLPMWDYESASDTHDWHISVLGLDALALIHHQSNDQVTANHAFPLYGYRGSEAEGTRFSLIGFPPSQTTTWAWYAQERTPTLMAARLFPIFKYADNDQTHEREWGALLLYRHRSTDTTTTDQLIPFHTYEADRSNQSWQVSLVGIDPITLFRYRTSPVDTALQVFPIYGYQRHDASRRWTALGFPPFGEGSAVSLIEVADDPARTAHRFTPAYAYSYDRDKEEMSMNALYLYWYTGSKQASQHSAMPLGSLHVDDAAQEWRFTLLGLDPVVPASLVRHTVSPTEVHSLLFPLYDYRREGSDSSFSFGGISELSLFRYQTSAATTRHRFFPIYDSSHDQQQPSATLNVMLLYRDETSPAKTSNRLFPLWSYEDNRDLGETRLGFAGWAPFSLYQAVTSPTQRSRRLFPVYAHSTDLTTGRGETDVLWPLLNVKSQSGKTTEWSALWWLVHYERPTSGSYEFRLFGASKMALLRLAASPDRSSFELNPVLPLYSYSADQEKGTSWSFLGGLAGVDSGEEGRTRLRVFWLRI